MSLSRSEVRTLFDGGHYGRILEAINHLEHDTATDLELAVLVAHASFEAGAQRQAQALALSCLESPLPGVKARAQLVLALCLRAVGQLTEARRLHQASNRCAEESGDSELDAWTALHLFRHLIVSAPRDVAGAMLPSVRGKVLRLASARASAFLHATVAVGEGHAGRVSEAMRHCRIAKTLVATAPHPWLQCSILGTMSAVALAGHDFETATESLDELQRIARAHALHADETRANVNAGHLAVIKGDYSAAERALREVTQSDFSSRIAKLAAADGLARCFLATGRLRECEDVLAAIERDSTEDAALRNVRGVQSAAITRARLSLKKGDAVAAIRYLERLRAPQSEALDRPLMVTAHLTAAEALTMTGQTAAAAQHLATSLSLNPLTLPELQGQFYYAAASTLAQSNIDLAILLRQRARRVWALHGTTALEQEFSHQSIRDQEPARPDNRPEVVVDTVANLLALGATPDLLLQEIQHSIQLLDCSPDVRLTDATEALPPSHSFVLAFPRANSGAAKLVCSFPDSPAKVMALASIVRVGETALELERYRESERQRAALWPDHSAEASSGVIAESDAMREALIVARRIADTTIPVLITGETGTGKEILARLIHSCSKRAKAPFLPFNCTSISRDMVESQLFGHKRGSFTGASEHSQGVIRAANRGTLLLDEIGEMGRELQPKLLRFLESNEVHPVGEPQPQKVDVRVVAATNADLKDLVAKGLFREDLYYRLSIVPIHLPPLRERRSEIPSLAGHYLAKYSKEFAKGDLKLSDDAVDHLVLFRWPGNIRQLANEMRRVAAMAETGAVVSASHLSSEITRGGSAMPRRTEPRGNEILVRLDQPLVAAVESLERAMVLGALKKAGGLVEPAARMLGISRKGLYLKRQRYRIELGIEDPEPEHAGE